MGFLDNLFNMADKREIKAFSKVADKIDAMEPKFEAMTNKELKNIKDETNAINSLIFCFLLTWLHFFATMLVIFIYLYVYFIYFLFMN